jgi:hypothetical protein
MRIFRELPGFPHSNLKKKIASTVHKTSKILLPVFFKFYVRGDAIRRISGFFCFNHSHL